MLRKLFRVVAARFVLAALAALIFILYSSGYLSEDIFNQLNNVLN